MVNIFRIKIKHWMTTRLYFYINMSFKHFEQPSSAGSNRSYVTLYVTYFSKQTCNVTLAFPTDVT